MTQRDPLSCTEARWSLWPPEKPRLHAPESDRAWEHVRSCRACSRHFREDRAFVEALGDLPPIPAPISTRERIFHVIAEARAAIPMRTLRSLSDRRLAFGASAVVVITIALSVSVLVPKPGTPDTTASITSGAVVEDYLRRTVGEDYIDTTDPGVVTRFLERELGVIISPLSVPGLEIERVEICLLSGERAAMIRYTLNGEHVSHYVLPTPSGPEKGPSLTGAGSPATGGTLPVVTWTSPGAEHAALGDLDPSALLRLVQGRLDE
ncbi:MAG: hypothetical protein RQ745_06640 [Longimicrobiales bacterium]|nr:hypothetical protein [Longimicrobiales bacterium]